MQSASSVEIRAFVWILDDLNDALDSDAEGAVLVETRLCINSTIMDFQAMEYAQTELVSVPFDVNMFFIIPGSFLPEPAAINGGYSCTFR